MADIKLDEDNNMIYKATVIPFGQAGLNNYYFTKNKKEIYGWAQDNNFTVEHLYYEQQLKTPYKDYLKNLNGRPPLSTNNPSLTFTNILNGRYDVQFYNTVTGSSIGNLQDISATNNSLIVPIPISLLNDPANQYADIAYKIKHNCHTSECNWDENPLSLNSEYAESNSNFAYNADKNHLFYANTGAYMCNMYFSNNSWNSNILNLTLPKVKSGSKIMTDNLDRVYYIGKNGAINSVY